MINDSELALLKKLGVIVHNIEYQQKEIPISQYVSPNDPIEIEVTGQFSINEEQFRPMCHLIRITDMICENKNPAVQEMYEQLVTLLFLTEES